MDFNTICVRGATDAHSSTGAVSVPIYQSSTFAHLAVGQSTGYDYSRLQNPTRAALENLVTSLEQGTDTLAFSSGMAAITTMMDLFEAGDHIIASADLYGGSIRLFNTICKKNGLVFDYVDTSHHDTIESHIQKNTKAIFVETPTNPMMHVTDIAAVSLIAKKHNLLLIVDNTFLSPYFLKPIALGADIVMHSGTKFLCGHNDTLAGFLTVANDALSEKLRFMFKTTGACLSPFDSWLLIRGIKTLALRMERQQENAIKLADWLCNQEKIKAVYFVGLNSHPQYDVSIKQSSGFGSMISFQTDSEETALSILENVKLILFAESLGGVESLITYPMLQTHADVDKAELDAKGINETLLRLSVGIEDADDLIADLAQAINR